MTSRLDSRFLRQFVAVAETLSFRQAAERLHISQPPLSRAIRELETRLGTLLFERDTTGVELTPAGQRLLPLARRILRLMAEAEAAVLARGSPASPQSSTRLQSWTRLRLGLTSAIEPQWFQKIAAAMEAHGFVIDVTADESPRLVRMLDRGKLDAAFIALPTHAPGVDIQVLDEQPLVAVLPVGHHLARRRIVSLAELAGDRLYWFRRARQPAFFDHCAKVFERHGFAPRVLEEPQDNHVLLAQVAAGRGIALLPASFARLRREGITYKRLREDDELRVGIGIATLPDRKDVRKTILRFVDAKA
jgi:DNA-binding transcriptional LysR family regulator